MKTQKKFQDKICIVTASSTGIGFAISKFFALEGAIVIINSRSKNNVDTAVNQLNELGCKAYGIVCHQAKKEDRDKLLSFVKQKFGKIDILVPNAAVNPVQKDIKYTIQIQDSIVNKTFEVNLLSTFLLIREALPLMPQNSSITIISSQGAYLNVEPQQSFYLASKYSLHKLTKYLANTLQKKYIRVNTIAPGLIKTDFGKNLWENQEFMKKFNSSVIAPYRIGEASDVANSVLFISSDEAKYINGEIINLSGNSLPRL